jgi:hypothetical protein
LNLLSLFNAPLLALVLFALQSALPDFNIATPALFDQWWCDISFPSNLPISVY